MPVQLDDNTALRIAELLDLFAELPSTPSVLTEEAKAFSGTITEQVAPPDRTRGFGHPPGGGATPR